MSRVVRSSLTGLSIPACAAAFLFVAGWPIASAARFAVGGPAAVTAGAEGLPHLQDAPRDAAKDAVQGAPPATAEDPNDPKLAGRFAGRVIGPDGRPIFCARVYIAPDDQKLKDVGPVRAQTDAEGRFEFNAPDMTYAQLDGLPARRQGLIVAAADGYAPDWMVTWGDTRSSFRSHLDPVKGADITLELAKDDAPIYGRLRDPDGRPLADARVRLIELMIPMKHDLDTQLKREAESSLTSLSDYHRQLHRPQVLPGITVETRTDAGGRFTISGLGRNRLAVLLVSAPNVVDTRITVMSREAPDVGIRRDMNGNFTGTIYGAGFRLQLAPGLVVTGVVRDRETLAPIAGMWVGLGGVALNGLIDGDYPTFTDKDGRFTITGLDRSMVGQQVMAVPQPGRGYLAATAVINGKSDVVIECAGGIPFHLKLTDEAGRPVEAQVTYQDINPNPDAAGLRTYDARWPVDVAARKSDGTYQGFVLPGPGAVLVKAPRGFSYRPAHVDPKAFFAPGRTNWTDQDHISTYGNHDVVSIHAGWWADQHDYAAIVLVNPAVNSAPLELSAVIARDRPRRVSLVDPAGNPVVGVETHGQTFHPWDAEPPLRVATFSLTKLHPDRVRRITFVKEDRKLIGFLMARGDGVEPYIVRMQPWGTLTGRLLDEDGNPIRAHAPATKQQTSARIDLGNYNGIVTNSDPEVGVHPGAETDADGRFHIERLVPGQRYSGRVYRGMGMSAAIAFENVILKPGETRDLGDIRTKPPIDVRGK
jgi:hypothetical protein